MRDPVKTFGANVQAEPTCGSQDGWFPVRSGRWEEAGGKRVLTGEATGFPSPVMMAEAGKNDDVMDT